jgi:hypothetical protein
MNRGPQDLLSAKRRYRIYNRAHLPDPYSRSLHSGGPWFWEPVDWSRAGPMQSGCRTAQEALNAANYHEEDEQVADRE